MYGSYRSRQQEELPFNFCPAQMGSADKRAAFCKLGEGRLKTWGCAEEQVGRYGHQQTSVQQREAARHNCVRSAVHVRGWNDIIVAKKQGGCSAKRRGGRAGCGRGAAWYCIQWRGQRCPGFGGPACGPHARCQERRRRPTLDCAIIFKRSCTWFDSGVSFMATNGKTGVRGWRGGLCVWLSSSRAFHSSGSC